MDDNTLYSNFWRFCFTAVAVIVVTGWALSTAVSWREAGIKVEVLRLETSPEGMEHARMTRDRAMYEAMAKSAKP